MPDDQDSLAELRRRIDDIDAAIHDLLMKRTEVTQRIGAVKGEDSVYMRPGREAIVLRRLIARHKGALPGALIVRIWREIFAAVTALQGPLAVAVYAPEGSFGYRNLARDHYGWRTPITAYRSAAQVLEAVGDGRATVGVLPVPVEDGVDPWWRNLARDGDAAPRIVARLPFAVIAPSGTDAVEALAISQAVTEMTGEDRAFLVIETGEVVSRSHLKRLLGEAGFEVLGIQGAEEDGGRSLKLVEVEGFVRDDDPRLARLVGLGEGTLSHVWAVGGFAVPLALEEAASPKAEGAGP
ncbi:MAG: chorismate mutase [Proteobacteria bacterium]|nr:chorismate mutase [Pseudomonadota bacterium]